MTIVKSISVGNGDLFYIKHGSDNFTIIDCDIADDRKDAILSELRDAARDKNMQRFISTHPDEDHIHGLEHIDESNLGWNFYCVKNNVRKKDETTSFKRYKKLRDDTQRAFYIYKGCSRYWLNESNKTRGSAGINILWPDTNNDAFLKHLEIAEQGGNSNNTCPIIRNSRLDF